MARTFKYQDVFNFVRNAVPATTEDARAAILANMATDMIWNAFDWRETIEVLPPFWLATWTQDYGAPQVAVPSDFLGLREAWVTDLSANPPSKYPIKVMRFLEPTHAKNLPQAISYEPSVEAFRVFPRTPSGLGPSRFKIDGTYKKRPTLLTAASYANTLLPFDDLYFETWVEVLRYVAWKSSGDPRAGAISTARSGVSTATGQAAVAIDAIKEMARSEGFELGDTVVAPSEALSQGSGWWQNRNFVWGW